MSSNDKRTSATWHLWSLDPVVTELQLCPAVRAAEMAELMIPKQIGFLDFNTGSAARRFQKSYNLFGSQRLDSPLLQRSDPPLPLTARSLKFLLQEKQSLSDGAQFYPPLIGDSRTAKQDLIKHLGTCHYRTYASTLTFLSSAMDPHIKPYIGTRKLNSTSSQGSVAIMTSIMHCGALIPLETSALPSTSEIHLLSGIRIYLIYPPMPNNMVLLQAYCQGVGKGVDHAKICSVMQEGITILQKPGQVVTIPPHCPAVIFAVETNAAVTLRNNCKGELPQRLEYLDLLVSQIAAVQRVMGHPEATDGVIEYKIMQFYKDLSAFLGAVEDVLADEKLILALGRAWKRNGAKFRKVLEQHMSEGVTERIVANVPKWWRKAVTVRNLKECPVCEEGIGDDADMFLKHFWCEHWARFD
ncbi:nicotinamidase pyrazinamidase [Pyrenophora seminiperda CCB06]|uniref:Nicotinamidase pyrazinamidase n=1 Tax=Pyrenophora seminiperda CCB06 TaxID=1302712 RepID=A0A3M7MIL2_9PLEO|nr:nicotinamidase pyrazinamidase [Pyrenophora seminiperda CCB06]